MKEVIMKVASFSADYPKAPIYVADLVRCKECRWCFYVESDDVYACIKKGIEHKVYNPKKHFCSYGEREGE